MALLPMEHVDDFTEITLTKNNSYVDYDYSKCYSNGKIVIANLCFRLSATPPVYTTVISGFPNNGRTTNYGSLASSGGAGRRLVVSGTNLVFEDSNTPSGVYYSGCVVYTL